MPLEIKVSYHLAGKANKATLEEFLKDEKAAIIVNIASRCGQIERQLQSL